MNVPGPRKHPSTSPAVQAQSQAQSRGPQQYPRGPTPPVNFRIQGQEGFDRSPVYQAQGGPQQQQYPSAQVQVQQVPQQQVQQQQQQIRAPIYQSYHPGGSPHDMNKSPMSTHVPQTGPTPQPGIPQQPMMYQPPNAQQAQRGGAPVQNFMNRPGGVPRQSPRMSMPQNQVPYNVGQPPQTTMFMPQQSPYNMGGHQVITIGGHPSVQVQYPQATGPRMQQAPQYTITTSQPAQFTMSPSGTYYPPHQPAGSGPVFYTQTPQPNAPTAQTQPRGKYTSERRKRIIQITDPNTGKDISGELTGQKSNTPPQQTNKPDSARATPVGAATPPAAGAGAVVPSQPPQPAAAPPQEANSDIAAQFAAQVAATLDNNKGGTPVAPVQSQQGGPAPGRAPGQAPTQRPVTVVQGTTASPVQPQSQAAAQGAEQTAQEAGAAQDSIPAAEKTATSASEAKSATPPEVASKEPTPEVESAPAAKSSPSVKAEKEPTPEKQKEPAPQPDVIEPKAKQSTPEPPASNPPIVVVPPSPDSLTQKEADTKRETEPTGKTPDVVPRDIGKPPVSPRAEDDGKDQRGKKGKRKARDLNQKGEAKEGSDMDAFTTEQSSANTESEETKSSASPPTEIKEPEPPVATSNGPESLSDTKTETDEAAKATEPSKESETTPEQNSTSQAKTDESKENEETNEDSSDFPAEETKPVIKKNKSTELKYKYRENQWSPLNPEGKKQYDRSFLLQLQSAPESLEKPAGLPKLPDVILDTPISNNERSYGGHGPPARRGHPDFTPTFVKSSPSGKGMNIKRNSAQKGRGGMGPHKVIQHTMGSTEVKLHSTENAWKPQLMDASASKSADELSSKTEELYKKMKGILNKLTPQKFNILVQQVLDLEIDSEERLTGCIDIIFEKALSEPNFSVPYANMCKFMINMKVQSSSKPEESITFKRLLLNRCQKEFEKDKAEEIDMAKRQQEIDEAPEEKKKELIDAKEYAEMKAKRRSLGNIRFIGELFKLKMLTENIMHECLLKLLRSNDEDNLECLCRLLTTIGKDIDVDRARARMDQYFAQIDKIVKQKRTCARIRFMLQDTADLRKNKWVPRRDDNNPKTIEQIHREAQEEEQQKAIMIQNMNLAPNKGSRGHRGGRGGGGGANAPSPIGDDGWQSVGRSNRNTIDPSRMKLTKQNVDDNIQLGPGGRPGFGGWGRGSSGGGSKTPSQEGEKPQSSTPANRFSALSAENYDPRRTPGGLGGRGSSRDRGDRGGRMSQDRDRRRGTPSGRASQEQDRESALAAVRNIASGGRSQSGSRQASGSRNQSRDSSRSRDVPREEPKSAPATAPKELSEGEIEKKTKAIMDEYIHIHDLKEAILCVKELESPKSIHMFAYFALSHVLERSNQARTKAGILLHDLVKTKVLTVDQYIRGLKELLEFAEDMEIDIPKIWQYLGELVSPMVQDNSVPLSFLRQAFSPLLGCNKAGTLVAEVLNEASQRLGHAKVGELWKQSGLQWSEFLPESENTSEFIKKHKLEFTVGSEEAPSPAGKEADMETVQVELDKLIVEQKVINEKVMDWVDANVGERTKDPRFIRALMTSVCSAAMQPGPSNRCNVQTDQIVKRTHLLQKYLDHNAELELQALYALQALVHKLEHPAGVLRGIFDILYDEDIISEDAFNQWEQSSDPAEQAGKGVALTSVLQFFTWLREAEEEEQEN